jgi:hypothetical protein
MNIETACRLFHGQQAKRGSLHRSDIQSPAAGLAASRGRRGWIYQTLLVQDAGLFEMHDNMEAAIVREKQIKAGSRKKKLALIESFNPQWRDLYGDIAHG